MVKEAEAHASEDARRRQVIEVRNETDSLVYSTSRSLTESGAKLTAEERSAIDGALDDAREALNGNDLDRIRRAQEGLRRAGQTLAEAQSREPSRAGGTSGGSTDVVDAEVVDEGKA